MNEVSCSSPAEETRVLTALNDFPRCSREGSNRATFERTFSYLSDSFASTRPAFNSIESLGVWSARLDVNVVKGTTEGIF